MEHVCTIRKSYFCRYVNERNSLVFSAEFVKVLFIAFLYGLQKLLRNQQYLSHVVCSAYIGQFN